MSTFTLEHPMIFPEGTSVTAHEPEDSPAGVEHPLGDGFETQVVTGGKIAFTTLADGRYVAWGLVGGNWRRFAFAVGDKSNYSQAIVDNRVPRRDEDESIPGAWTFLNRNTFGVGENQEIRVGTVADMPAQVLDGSAAAPSTGTRPAFKVSRVQELTIADAEAAGVASGAQPDHMTAAFSAVCEGTASSELQSTAIFAGAATISSAGTGLEDAAAIVTDARMNAGTGTAAAMVATVRREVDAGRATGIEMHVNNFTPTAGTYIPTGTSDVKGMGILAGGDSDSGCGIHFIHLASGAQFKVGIGFGSADGGPVADSTIRDDSTATDSLDIRGTHTHALKVAAGAGRIAVEGAVAGDTLYTARTTGDVSPRVQIRANGDLRWSNGTNLDDVQLRRAGVGHLNAVATKFTAENGLGAGNTVVATTAVGALARKMEVFDVAGASLGFVPIYDAIS